MDSEPASQSERLPSLTHVSHKRCVFQEPLGDILHHWCLVDVLRIKYADSCGYCTCVSVRLIRDSAAYYFDAPRIRVTVS
jgi:hypothetical protein